MCCSRGGVEGTCAVSVYTGTDNRSRVVHNRCASRHPGATDPSVSPSYIPCTSCPPSRPAVRSASSKAARALNCSPYVRCSASGSAAPGGGVRRAGSRWRRSCWPAGCWRCRAGTRRGTRRRGRPDRGAGAGGCGRARPRRSPRRRPWRRSRRRVTGTTTSPGSSRTGSPSGAEADEPEADGPEGEPLASRRGRRARSGPARCRCPSRCRSADAGRPRGRVHRPW